MVPIGIFILSIFVSLTLADSQNVTYTIFDEIPQSCSGLHTMTSPFVKIGEKYYFFETSEKEAWFKAAHNCRQRHAELASVESATEMDDLTKYLTDNGHGNLRFWLSGNDLGKEGEYFWLRSGKGFANATWANGEPNGGTNENCVEIIMARQGFNDNSCNTLLNYICETNKPTSIIFNVS